MNLKLIMRMTMVLFLLTGVSSVVFAQFNQGSQGSSSTSSSTGNTSIVETLTSQLCGIVGGVRTVIGVIALVMFLVGGVLYAVGHFMPAAGQVKASMQGWAMGMILGGVVGVILVILAPFIVTTILNFGSGLSSLPC